MQDDFNGGMPLEKLFRAYKPNQKSLANLEYRPAPFLAFKDHKGHWNPDAFRDLAVFVLGFSCLVMALCVFVFMR